MTESNRENSTRILHISTATSWRGGEQQLAYLLSHLPAECENTVICPVDAPLAAFCARHNITCLTYRRRGALSFQLARIIKQQATITDMIHAHDANAHSNVFLANIIFKLNLPLIVHRRVIFPIKSNWLTRKKFTMSSLNKVICISSAVQQICLGYGLPPEKLALIPSAIDASRFANRLRIILRHEFNVPASTPIIGYVAALTAEKDHLTFIRTAQHILAQGVDATFFMIGEGKQRPFIESMIRQYHLEDKLILTGFRSDIPDMLSSLDVLLFTSKSEGLGTSVLDAFACKVPVVANDCGGINDIIIPDETGLMAPIGDVIQLSHLVRRVLAEPHLRIQLIDKAYASLQRFTPQKMAQDTAVLYQHVLSSS